MADKKDKKSSIEDKLSDDAIKRAHHPKNKGVTPIHTYFNEWLQYQGKVFDEVSGKYIAKEEILQRELGETMQDEAENLKKNLKGKEHDETAVSSQLYDIGKKAYLAQRGIKDEKTFIKSLRGGEKELEEHVKDFIAQITKSQSYEEALAHVLEQDIPYELSKTNPLSGIIQLYAQASHESKTLKYTDGKGLRFARKGYLDQRIQTSKFYKDHLIGHGKKVLSDFGYKGLDFAKNTENTHVMETIESLMAGRDINTKASYFKGKRQREEKSKTYEVEAHKNYAMDDPYKKAA